MIGLVEDLVFSLTVFDTDGLASVAEVQASISPATNGNKVFLLEENFAPWMEGSGIASIGLFNFDVDTNTGTLMPSVYTKENQSLAFNFAQDGLTLTVNFEGSGLVQDISTSFNDAFDEVTTTTRVNQAVLTLIEDGAGMDFAISQSIGNLTTFNETQTVEVSTVAFDTTDIVSIYELNGRVPLEVEGKTLSLLTNVSTQIDTLPDGGGFPGLQLDGLTFNQDGTGFAAEKSQSLLWTNDPNGYIRVVFSDGEVGEYYHVATGASGDVVVAAYTDVNDIAIAMAELSFTQDPTLIVDSSTVAGIYTSLYDLSSADFPEIYSYTTRLAPDGTGEVQYITVLESGELFSLTNTVGICWSFNDGGEFIADAVSSSQVVPGSNRPATEFCDSRLPKEGDLRYEKISYTNRQSVTRESEYFCSGELCAYQVNRLYASVVEPSEIFIGDPPRAASSTITTPVGVPADVAITSLAQDADGSLDLTSIEIVVLPATGTLSIDASSGVITYTPTRTVAHTDVFAYQIRDDAGNLSNAALVDVIITTLDVTVTSSSLSPLSGELVTLSAGATESGVTYTWTQTGGTAVTLSDTTASSPTFIVSDVALLPTASVDERTFSVTVENADGETVVGEVVVTVDAVMPLAFFGVEESTIPIQYGVDLNPNRSFSVTMAADGASGVYGNGFGEFSFGANNLEDVGILEFTGLDGAVMHSYELDGYDENNDAVFDETIVFTDYAEELVFSLVIDGEGKDIVSVLERGVIKAFNATLGLPSTSQSDVAYTTTREFTIYDASSTIAFKINDEVRSLQTNIGAKVPTLRANRLFVDTLTFDSTSLTGSALKLDETFVWSVAIDGHLVVDFANGDEAEYYHLATRDTGDVVAVVYTEALGTPTRSNVNLSFTQTVPTWTNDIANHAGLYVDIEGFVDSAGNSNVFEYHFRVNPDGTGVEEFHSILSDGSESWSASDLAICARIDVSTEEMIWSRAHAGTQGESVDALSSMPLAGYCQSLTDSQISFQQAHTLFDVTSSGQYGMTLRQKSNTCGYFPVSDPKNCDLPGTLVTDDVYPRVMQYTAFANFPPVAIADAVTVFELTSTVIDVLANDLDGRNSALGANEPSGSVDLMDATTVEIIKQPTSGAATVDPNSGEITYTSDAGAISDVFYYRVKNVSGDSSNVGIVNVGIFAPVLVVTDMTANQSTIVTLDGSTTNGNGGIVSYQWAQVSGTEVELIDANSKSASFTAPAKLLGTTDVLEFSLTIVGANGLTSVTKVQASIEPARRGNKLFASYKYHEPTSYGSGIRPLGLFTFDTASSVGDVVPSYYAGEDQDLDFSYTVDGLEMTVSFVGLGLPEYVDRYNSAGDVLRYTNSIIQAVLTLTDDGDEADLFSMQSLHRQVTFNETQGVEVNTSDYESTDIVAVHGFEGRVPLEVENQTISLLTNVSTEIDTLDDFDGYGLQLDGLSFNEDGTGFAAEKAQSFNWFSDPENGYIRVEFADRETSEYHHVASTTSGNVVVAVYTFGNNVKIARAELSFTQDPTLIVKSDTVAGIYTSQEIWVWNLYTDILDMSIRLAPDGTGEEETIHTGYEDGVLNHTALWPSGMLVG